MKLITSREELADRIITDGAFRRNVYNLIPQGTRRILDFGCGSGAFLLRLARDKKCSELYGVELNPTLAEPLKLLIDGVWDLNLENEEAELGSDYQGFFQYIVAHDVAEHLYDPWYTFEKLRGYLAPGGKLIVVTPNLQYWDFLHNIMTGRFAYAHGLWHVGHIRWYTFNSLIELVTLAGYDIERLCLEIPMQPDLGRLDGPDPIHEIQMPPVEVAQKFPAARPIRLQFNHDIRKAYPLFLAHKLIAVCGRGTRPVAPTRVGDSCEALVRMRPPMDIAFDLDDLPDMHLLTGPWS